MADNEAIELNGVNKAAILLLSVGEKTAAEIFKHLGPKEVQRLGVAMAAIKNVNKNNVTDVMDSFLETVDSQTALGIGTEDYIRNSLRDALGNDKADALLERILTGANNKGLDTLKWIDTRAVADMIRYEHPQIQAIVLSYLDPDQSAEIMGQLPEENRVDLALRIANLDTVQPAALEELNRIMEKQFTASSTSRPANLGGVKAAADILNFLDSSVEAKVMEGIRENSEELGQQIQDYMFVFDNLADIEGRGIQTLLKEVQSDRLLLALRGASDLIKEKVFGNMSKRAADLLRDDLEAMGPVKLSEVEDAQKEIIAVARRLAESGDIMIGGMGEELV